MGFIDGMLTLDAGPQTLEYPAGSEEALTIALSDFAALPPYVLEAAGTAPWLVDDAEGWAFVVNPTHLRATEPVSVRIDTGAGSNESLPEGTVFDLYAVNADTAIAELVGTATTDANGQANSSADSQFTHLTTLIAVRRPDMDPVPGP